MNSFKLLILFTLLYFSASSQTAVQGYPYKDNSFPHSVNIGDSILKKTFIGAVLELGDSLSSKKGVLLPRGFTADMIAVTPGLCLYDRARKTLAIRNDTGWVYVGAGTGSPPVDISGKLNISDTANMLLPYFHVADTTGKWVIDMFVKNDSLFKFRAGVESFTGIKNYSPVPIDGHTGCPLNWSGNGLTYNIGVPCSWNIGGQTYSINTPQTIIIDDGDADPGEFRHDAIVGTTSNTVTIVKGNNSVGGQINFPYTDPSSQHVLGIIRIDEDNTINTDLSREVIRDEGAGGEATVTTNGTITRNASYGTNPYPNGGTISERFTAIANNAYWQYQKATGFWKKDDGNIEFNIKNNAVLNRNLIVRLLRNGVQNGTTSVSMANHGYNPATTQTGTNYQKIIIPISAFNLPIDSFNQVRVTATNRAGGGGSVDYQVDYVNKQSSVIANTPPPTYTFLNGNGTIASVTGSNVKYNLGGTLTQGTSIAGAGYNFGMSGLSSYTIFTTNNTGKSGNISVSPGGMGISSTDAANTSEIVGASKSLNAYILTNTLTDTFYKRGFWIDSNDVHVGYFQGLNSDDEEQNWRNQNVYIHSLPVISDTTGNDIIFVNRTTGKLTRGPSDMAGGGGGGGGLTTVISSSTSLSLSNSSAYYFTGTSDAAWILPATGGTITIKNKSVDDDITVTVASAGNVFYFSQQSSLVIGPGEFYEFHWDGTDWSVK